MSNATVAIVGASHRALFCALVCWFVSEGRSSMPLAAFAIQWFQVALMRMGTSHMYHDPPCLAHGLPCSMGARAKEGVCSTRY